MNELEMQQLIVDAVNGNGGFAHKMSNRFLIGVADLLVKPHNWGASVIEAKRYDHGPKPVPEFVLEVTVPQKKFLKHAFRAGMASGVASFMQEHHKGLKSLHLHIYTLSEIENIKYMAQTVHHSPLGHPDFRDENIYKIVCDFYIRWAAENAERIGVVYD